MASTALIFDLDGTLWDSRWFYAKAVSVVGGDFDRAMQDLADGLSAARLLREAGILPPKFIELVISNKQDLRLYPSVRNALNQLKRRPVPLGVVTSLPGWIALPMLSATGLSELFSTVVDWGRCCSAKPSPRPILRALEDLNAGPGQNVWYIGDSTVDVQAARAARVSFAWASYGYGPEELNDADRILKSFEDVLLL